MIKIKKTLNLIKTKTRKTITILQIQAIKTIKKKILNLTKRTIMKTETSLTDKIATLRIIIVVALLVMVLAVVVGLV